jgi:hypothetical protein
MDNSVLIHNATVDEICEKICKAVLEEILKQKTQSSPDEEEHYTRKETAKKLRISLPTLNTYTKNGLLKSYSIGNRILYSKMEVEEAIKLIPYRRR